MAGNMEDLLLNESDDSDDDSGDDVDVDKDVTSLTTTTATAQIVAAQQQQQQQQQTQTTTAAAAPPTAVPSTSKPSTSSDLNQRLKSLYSSSSSSNAVKSSSRTNASSSTDAPPPSNRNVAPAPTSHSAAPHSTNSFPSPAPPANVPPPAATAQSPSIAPPPHRRQQQSQPTAPTVTSRAATSSSSKTNDPFEPTPLAILQHKVVVKSSSNSQNPSLASNRTNPSTSLHPTTNTMTSAPSANMRPQTSSATSSTINTANLSITNPHANARISNSTAAPPATNMPIAAPPSSQIRHLHSATASSVQPPKPSNISSAPTPRTTATKNSTGGSQSLQEKEAKQRKEKFLMFTRVLMKYLEQKDPQMHSQAKFVIRECAKKNQGGDPAFASLSKAMQTRLRELVGPTYWKRAEDYLTQFLQQQYLKKQQGQPNSSNMLTRKEAFEKARQVASYASSPLPALPPATLSHTNNPKIMTTTPHPQQQNQQPPRTMNTLPITNTRAPSTQPPPQIQHRLPPANSSNNPNGISTNAPIPITSTNAATIQNANTTANGLMSLGTTHVVTSPVPPPSTIAPPNNLSSMQNPLLPNNTTTPMVPMNKLPPHNNKGHKQSLATNTTKKKKTASEKKKMNDKKKTAASNKTNNTKIQMNNKVPFPSLLTTPNNPTGNIPRGVGLETMTTSSSMAPSNASTNLSQPHTIGSSTAVTSTSTNTSTSKKKKITAAQRRQQAAAAALRSNDNATGITNNNPNKVMSPPPKEYAEFMEMLDHATMYDVASMLSTEYIQSDVFHLSTEQKTLLYGNGHQDTPPTLQNHSKYPIQKGWGTKNILSVRAAWAKLRLPELEKLKNLYSLPPVQPNKTNVGKLSVVPSNNTNNATKSPTMTGTITQMRNTMASSTANKNNNSLVNPVLYNTFSNKTVSNVSQPPTSPRVGPSQNYVMSSNISQKYSWYNEDKAEQDLALVLLSEATNEYVKSILQGAKQAARQRLNLNGVRLWHQQHMQSSTLKQQQSVSPSCPLSLRLGCDIKRQAAAFDGNAAKTCQRMEEALRRYQRESSCTVEDTTLTNQTIMSCRDMGELSKKPALAQAADRAAYCAKRNFETYGGKYSTEPPLGRVPKKIKITTHDLRLSVENFSFPQKGRRNSRSSMLNLFFKP